MLTDARQQLARMRADHVVIRLATVALDRQNAVGAHMIEVLTHRGRRQAGGLSQLTNAEPTVQQQVHKAQAMRVRQHAQDFGRLLEVSDVHQSLCVRYSHIIMISRVYDMSSH